MKILLIDDDVFLRDMYATKFSESGHVVTAVETAERALEALEKEKHDVVLLDMIMPGMTGVEFLREANARNILNNTVCIVLSNQGGKDEIDSALRAGAKGYIIKAELIPSEVVQEVTRIVSS